MLFDVKKISNDRGVVSILVAMIMMVVIGLIVLGFALVSDNEQKGSLNRQLSAEAYYAADSGINYATADIEKNPASIQSQLTCTGPYNPVSGGNTLTTTYGVSNPCLTVNPASYLLPYDINAGTTKVIPLKAQSGNINSINFKWDVENSAEQYNNCLGDATNFPTTTSWPSTDCDASVLQVDIVPIGGNLLSSADVIYLFPVKTTQANTGNLSTSPPSPAIYPVGCTSGNECSFTLKTTALTVGEYYLRVLPIYGGATTALTLSANGETTPLVGAEVIIDSTGKAQTVLQGLQATVDISGLNSSNSATPPFAIQSYQPICAEQELTNGTAGVRDLAACGNVEQNH